jgi:peptidyl-prolyl cis-trans isomerase B (cyclophilin B)
MPKRSFVLGTGLIVILGLAAVMTTPQGTSAASFAVTDRAATSTVRPSTGVPRVAGNPETSNQCGFENAIPADRYQGLPPFTAASAARPYTATLQTTQGNITFRALTSAAPCTTFSFRFLAQGGYFNGTHCHRLTVQGIYVLQCGDPTGTGAGGPGYVFNDENLSGATYPAGTVAMANAGPNTNGSQFFICWQATSLSPDYTPFGVVVTGMNVLSKIAAAGDDQQNGPGDGYPTLYVQFKKVAIDLGS